MAHDVFLSHSSQNRTVASAVCARLEERKIRCWIAPRDIRPGVDYGEALAEAIDESRVLVLILTSPANQSHHVRREIERAISKGIPVIPLRTEDVPLSKALQYFLGSVHWLDALTPPLEQHIESLARTIRQMIEESSGELTGHSRPGTPPPVAPIGLPEVGEPGPVPALPDVGPAAPMGGRVAAFLIDGLAVGTLAAIFWLLLVFTQALFVPEPPPDVAAADDMGDLPIYDLIGSVLASFVGYFTLFDGLSGLATLGKRLLGLKVVRVDGGPVPPGRALIRAVGKLLFCVTSVVGAAVAAADPRKRALHDLLAGTLVVRASGGETAPTPGPRGIRSGGVPADVPGA